MVRLPSVKSATSAAKVSSCFDSFRPSGSPLLNFHSFACATPEAPVRPTTAESVKSRDLNMIIPSGCCCVKRSHDKGFHQDFPHAFDHAPDRPGRTCLIRLQASCHDPAKAGTHHGIGLPVAIRNRA